MRYEAFRVNHGVLKGPAIDYSLYDVQGQRETDLNWERIGGKIFTSEEEAKNYAFTCRQSLRKSTWCPIFDPSGYGYKGSY